MGLGGVARKRIETGRSSSAFSSHGILALCVDHGILVSFADLTMQRARAQSGGSGPMGKGVSPWRTWSLQGGNFTTLGEVCGAVRLSGSVRHRLVGMAQSLALSQRRPGPAPRKVRLEADGE